MLGCFVVGEDQAFIIEIDRTKTISQLRDTIKAYKENVFKTLDANQLRLWKVNIPLIKAREINAETNIAQKFGAVELKDVFDTIEEHFGTNPTAKNIHVIVQPPPPVTSASSMHNEVKIEVKNKVLKAFSHINPNSVDGIVDVLSLIWNVEEVEEVESYSSSSQNDPCAKLKMKPSFFKINLPGTITKNASQEVDLCLPPHESESGMKYNPFYDDTSYPKDITVLTGVSGGGKTSTAFGISIQHWSIYVDFSTSGGQYGDFMGPELESIRAKPPRYGEYQTSEQIEVFNMLDLAIIARGLLLIKMLVQERISTPKEWLFEQLQIDINYIGAIKDILRNVNYISVFRYIVECLHVKSLILILDEAQVLCRTGYGKYNGSSKSNKKWSLLQAYVEHLTHRPVTCLIAGTYLHMATGIPLVASMGKPQSLHAHIMLHLKLATSLDISSEDDLETVHHNRKPTNRTKDQEMRVLIRLWFEKMSTDIADYLEDACNYVGADNLYPEKAIMDVLRHDESFSEEITINPSFESYLIPGIEAFFQRRGKSLVDVFIDNIILLNNNSSIGNEFDAVFITAIIQKRGCNVRDELNKWKNGQQFDLPSWITSTMKFVTISNLSNAVPLARYVSDETYCRRAIQLEPCSGSDLKLVIPAANEEDDLEDDDLEEDDLGEGDLEEEEYGQDLDFDGVDYDLNYTENTKNYRVSDKKNHEAIKNSTKNRKHIYISVELPRRRSKRLKLFRINEYGDLVIIVDDRNMEHVFGPVIKNLMETLRQRCENKENSMDLTE
uniref:Crinkler effector protein N-terminal domain-containing protein n=1 Tax=Rhizophagus irregularis (strain DAOM 181602 / DAOM 197198 / MUCL 43194) TaxID=747089 RepID=U9U1L3_RHIID